MAFQNQQQGQGTFKDGLTRILGEIAQLAGLPDANQQAVVALQQVIHKIMAMPAPQGQGGQGPMGGQPPMQGGGMAPQPGMAGAMPGMARPMPGGGIGGMGGFGGASMGNAMPNPDELRRVLAAGAGGGQ